MELTAAQLKELRDLTYCPDVPATVGGRARIVLWHAEKRPMIEIAAMAGVPRPTVDVWLARYAADGIAGLPDRKRGAGREQVPGRIRARILAATRSAPPQGLSHWSSREMVKFIARTEKVTVSHHYVAKLWRATGLKPQRQGTWVECRHSWQVPGQPSPADHDARGVHGDLRVDHLVTASE